MKDKFEQKLLKEIRLIQEKMGLGFDSYRYKSLAEQITPSPTGVPINPKIEKEIPKALVSDKTRVDPRMTGQMKGRGPGPSYFNFANLAKIPYIPGRTTFYYLKDPVNVGELLGVKNKDYYGYYDEIFIESYGQKIKRYYPTNDWLDWKFLIQHKIPYAFLNRDNELGDRFFHLILKLVDPTKSVIDLEDPNNKSRGWVLSGPGLKTSDPTDSGTGYYYTDGDRQIPYNITAPLNPGEVTSFDLDERSDFDRFMDSYAAMALQIVIQIVVTIITRNLVIGQITAESAVTILGIQSRLLVITMLAEASVNIPFAVYYFNRPGYETLGFISLLFCFIPYLQYQTALRNIIEDFSVKTALEIAEKIVTQPVGKMTTRLELEAFMEKLTLEQKVLFIDVLKNMDKINPLLKNSARRLAALSERQLMQNTDYVLTRKQILQYASVHSGFIKSFVADFSSTIFIMKLAETGLTVLDSHNESMETQSKKKQEDAKANLKKVEIEAEKFPEWVKMSINTQQFKLLPLNLTLEDVEFMFERGMISPGLYEKIKEESMRQVKQYLKDHPSPENDALSDLLKIIDLWKKFKEDPTMKNILTDEDKKLLDKYIKEREKVVEERKNKEKEEKEKKDQEAGEKLPTLPLPNEIEYGWKEVDKIDFAVAELKPEDWEFKTETQNNVEKYFIKPKQKLALNTNQNNSESGQNQTNDEQGVEVETENPSQNPKSKKIKTKVP